MQRTVRASLDAFQLASSLCGLPFVGAAATIVLDIITTCDEVRIQKKRSKLMAGKCVQLLSTFHDQSSRLVGSELQGTADELMAVFERILRRVRPWSRYSFVVSFVRSAEISEGLEECDSELNAAIICQRGFVGSANIVIYESQRELHDRVRDNSAETRDLIYQILINQGELQQVHEMQNAGEHIAESIMEAGQLELRQLRENTLLARKLMIATVQSASPSPQPADAQRYLQYQRGLLNLHRLTGIPPSVKVLNGEVTKSGDLPIAGGTYSDIWLGEWLGEKKVALKALRNIKAYDTKAKKRVEHEITVWANLQHDHILPFYGVVTDQGQHIFMVCPWQDNGNVLDYVRTVPDVDRIHLLSGAAKGLEYLHSCNVIHGNVKCANILVSQAGEACICDFGMSKVIEEVTDKSASATLTTSGSARWLAPELIEGVITSPTKKADTYSYAMAVLELLTGKHPFSHRSRDASVIHDVVVLKRTPPRPEDADVLVWLTDDLWKLLEECWLVDPTLRPPMRQISASMAEFEK
ncbi:TKL/TKL-ccin protein kinase [Tricholoma matsutake]|nr:TKL/TKL-ccin protein kinase [Tricholoma matsutake 945]